MKNKSFTLIELLVVIVIIGVLAGVIIVTTTSSIGKANIAKLKVFEESVANNLAANMVSRWKLDERTGTSPNYRTPDAWGNNTGIFGDDATATTFPTPLSESNCVSGKCLSFDGGDYIDCGNDSSLNITENMAIGVWIKPNSVAGYKMIATKSGGTVLETQWELRTYNDRVEFLASNGITAYIAYKDGLSVASWYYVVGVLKSSVFSVYLNGIKGVDATLSGTKSTTNYSTKMGTRKDASESTYRFNGSIDDLRMYNAALSSFQIKQNYIAGLDSLLSNGAISKSEYDQRIGELAEN